jgi:transposase
MKAYSIDLRKRVMSAYDAGTLSINQIAERFAVSDRWIYKLKLQRDREGSIAPKPQNAGRKPAFSATLLQDLEQYLQDHCDATLEEIREHFSDRIQCSLQAVANAVSRLGWRYKKNRYEPASKAEKT